MNLQSKLFLRILVFSFVFRPGPGWTEASRTDEIEWENTVQRLREELHTAGSKSLILPADATRRFLAWQLRVVGNSALTTSELLENLPLVYYEYEIDPVTGKPKMDPVEKTPVVSETYDFRVIWELIVNPGPLREISAKAITAGIGIE